MEPPVTLRLATEADEPFLHAAYASSRAGAPDLAVRHPDSAAALLRHEFESRQTSYRIDFPGVKYCVIEQAGECIGRVYLQETRRRLFIVDLVLLPPWRGRGLGTRLLCGLLEDAAAEGKYVQLHVHKQNRSAQRLYERLGFIVIDDAVTHHLMEWRCA